MLLTPLSDAINALAFDQTGTLFGINNDGMSGGPPGSPSHTHLITIDTGTGMITDIGPSLDNLDAIAFLPVPSVPVLSSFGQALFVGVVCLRGLLFLRRQ